MGLKVNHVRFRHKTGQTSGPLNQREVCIHDVAHAECDPPKWLTEWTQHLMPAGKPRRSCSVQSRVNPRCTKTAGPIYSDQLPFCVVVSPFFAAAATPGATGCPCFLMCFFNSGDKVSYPRWLKRPPRSFGVAAMRCQTDTRKHSEERERET